MSRGAGSGSAMTTEMTFADRLIIRDCTDSTERTLMRVASRAGIVRLVKISIQPTSANSLVEKVKTAFAGLTLSPAVA